MNKFNPTRLNEDNDPQSVESIASGDDDFVRNSLFSQVMTRTKQLVVICIVVASAACSHNDNPNGLVFGLKLTGPLVSSRTTMTTAWEFPKNPLTDVTLDDSKLSNEIRSSFRIFTNTPRETPQFAPGQMSCNNCHLNGGQRELSLPL